MTRKRSVLAAATILILSLSVGAVSSEETGAILTNKLAGAASPYLRDAARQPVAWLPWGDEPFRLARALDRPILLDIGAVWCHWCHVMDEQTYSDPDVARLTNAQFIAIKVDRDERPDIDATYQEAVQALTGQGGWPLTVFLTPDGKVFQGGTTFFPDDRTGQPGLKTLLPKLAEAYHARRGVTLALADRAQQALADARAAALRPADLSPGIVDAVAQRLVQSFDSAHGGFGRTAKVPAEGPIALGLRLYAEHGDQLMLGIVTRTLDEIARGGIHDHVGGGFHRAAVDRAWQIPHVEKLAYVNAQLLTAYLHAYQATGQVLYREVAEGIIAYTNRVLSDHARGGFFAHQDADMHPGDDGGYYTWDPSEVEAALPRDEAEVIVRYYGITSLGNVPGSPGRTVLRVVTTAETLARELSRPLSTVHAQIASGTARLLEARNKRRTPFVDPTLFADRNAMMISAYFDAYRVLRRDDLKAFAVKSLERVLSELRSEDGDLSHAYAQGNPRVPALLSDYAWVSKALCQGFQATGDLRYLTSARDLMDRALQTFWDPVGGGFFDFRPEGASGAPKPARAKTFTDGSVPAPNAVAALVLDQLAELTNAGVYREKAERLLKAFAGSASGHGHLAAAYALALELHLRPPAHAVIIGPLSDARTQALWQAALGAFRPGAIVAAYDPSAVRPGDLPPPVLAAMRNTQALGVPQAYVCVATACSLPVSDPATAAKLLATFERQAPDLSRPTISDDDRS